MAAAAASRQVWGCCSLGAGGRGESNLSCAADAEDLAVAGVDDEDLGGLSAAINAE